MRKLPLFGVLVLLLLSPVRAEFPDHLPDSLHDYVHQPDDSYRFEIHETTRVGTGTHYAVKLTSQTWRGLTWEHWLSLLVPDELRHPDRAVIVIGGRSNRQTAPSLNPTERALMEGFAREVGAMVAVVEQVPNQPLFDGLHEDALIALTFDRYLRGEGEDWPLLLPMVKSVTRTMDAISDIAREKHDQRVDRFLLTGASKRGWTTYLAAAVDERVFAIAPMVFDTLNLGPQMRQQVASYGRFSEKVDDYTERRLQFQMDTEEGKRLTALVDPFTYRERLTMPKLIVLGTNDPYWTVDASSLYVDDLVGETHLYYQFNAGHVTGPTLLPTLLAFTKAAMQDQSLPGIQWRRQHDGALHVTWGSDHASPVLCVAHSSTRDFRQATWERRPLTGEGECVVSIAAPEEGYTAYYVEVVFQPPGQAPHTVCTPITVTPDTFPFADAFEDEVQPR